MKPIEFKEQNLIYAKDQPEYLPLPANRDANGVVTTCWELTPEERLEVFNTGKIWLRQITFNQPLQPVNMFASSPFYSYTVLNVEYLMQKHPELNRDEAIDLLTFCHSNTIRLVDCYGDGSIMYPKWKESKK